MGRPSKTQEAETFSTYVEAVSSAITDMIGSSERALNLIAEEGIWLALGYNTFIILGRVNQTKNPIEYAQREILVMELRALSGGVQALTNLADFTIKMPDLRDPLHLPPIEFKPIEDLSRWILPVSVGDEGGLSGLLTPAQPLQFVYGLIQPIVEVAAIKLDDGTYMPLPFHYRIIVSLLLPGTIRSLVDILSQRSTLTLG